MIITENKNQDPAHCGYHTVYGLKLHFESQSCLLNIEVWPDNKIRLRSVTDGYHWLQYWLSQEDDAKELIELGYQESENKCKDLFKLLSIGYDQENKETAWLTLPIENINHDIVYYIAELIYPKFANREKFFKD